MAAYGANCLHVELACCAEPKMVFSEFDSDSLGVPYLVVESWASGKKIARDD